MAVRRGGRQAAVATLIAVCVAVMELSCRADELWAMLQQIKTNLMQLRSFDTEFEVTTRVKEVQTLRWQLRFFLSANSLQEG